MKESMLRHSAGCGAAHIPRPVAALRLPCHTPRQARQPFTAQATPSAAVEAPVQPAVSHSGDDVCIAEFPAPGPARFQPDRSSFFEQHRIRGYEVRPDQKTTIVTISNLLQEVAGNHAVGMWGRSENGFANLPNMEDIIFVMTRLQIRMQEYPKWGDLVTVETYFTEEGRLAARREWVITDTASGKVLGSATSTWVTINIATRRIVKLPDDVKAKFMRFTPRTPRQAIPAEETKRKLPDMVEADAIAGPEQIARRSDMDMNGHINNVTYLAWALESLPQDVYDNSFLFETEVDFKAECHAGERIETLCMQTEPDLPGNNVATQYVHTLKRAGAQELVRCRTSWVHKA